MMQANVGKLDSGLRIVVAFILAVLIATDVAQGVWAYVAGIIAIIILVTSVVRFCPLYALLGLQTCPRSNKSTE